MASRASPWLQSAEKARCERMVVAGPVAIYWKNRQWAQHGPVLVLVT